jgi:hypothetical protein
VPCERILRLGFNNSTVAKNTEQYNAWELSFQGENRRLRQKSTTSLLPGFCSFAKSRKMEGQPILGFPCGSSRKTGDPGKECCFSPDA